MDQKQIVSQIDSFLAELDKIESKSDEGESSGLSWDRLERWKSRAYRYLDEQLPSDDIDDFPDESDTFADLIEEIDRCRHYLVALRDDLLSCSRVDQVTSVAKSGSPPNGITSESFMENVIEKVKKHPAVLLISFVAVVFTGLGQLTDSFKSLTSVFPVKTEEKGAVQQKMENSPNSIQAGGDVNINVETGNASPSPVARFPFNMQIARAKERIKYLSQDYLKVDTMSLVEVKGLYGDNMLDAPELYDWEKVMRELEKQGFVKIIRSTQRGNIEFQVLQKK